MDIKFYDVKKEYLDYLYRFDREIRYAKKKVRPYLFIKISISNNKEYLIPLSSPKVGKMRAKDICDFIYDKNNIILAYLEYHKMIPFKKISSEQIQMQKNYSRYSDLLLKEYNYCRDVITFKKIEKKANEIYGARYNEKHYLYRRYLKNFACDFKKLEEVAKIYYPSPEKQR